MRIARVFGISIELHQTFIWLIVLAAVLLAVLSPEMFFSTMLLLFFLFASVLVHELFHSFVAIARGGKIQRIVLLPIGGISMADEMPDKPLDEFLIAIAGPLFNFLVVIAILLLVAIFPQLPFPQNLFSDLAGTGLEDAVFQFPLFALLWVNLILGAFNLFLPAFPLDGGRVLRAILAAFLGNVKATRIASIIGRFLAGVLFIAGFLIGDFIVLIIAVFIFLGAGQENEFVELRELMKGIELEPVINKRPLVLNGNTNLEDASKLMQQMNKPFLLVDMGDALGFISSGTLSSIKKSAWWETKAMDASKRIPIIDLKKDAKKIALNLFAKNFPALAVVGEKSHFIGIIEAEALQNLIALARLKNKTAQ
ncbi:MAG: M50 family metallopeptidase [Candidatus Diapherotrites archaeon]